MAGESHRMALMRYRSKSLIKSLLKRLWLSRGHIPLFNFPILYPLPYGGWIWVYPDENGISLLRGYQSEEGIWRYLRKYLRSQMTCVDVGSNQGFYAMLFLRHGCEEVYCFEPLLSMTKRMSRNLRINNLPYPHVEHLAVSHSLGTAEFNVAKLHESRSSLAELAEEVGARSRKIQVNTTSLDEYFGSKRIDVLKIDAEGAERDILRGAESILRAQRPLIVMELADVCTHQFGYNAEELLSLMRDVKYIPYLATRNGLEWLNTPPDEWRDTLIFLPLEQGHLSGL